MANTNATDARTAIKNVKATLAQLEKANAKAKTEAVQAILCELTEACESALAELKEVADEDED